MADALDITGTAAYDGDEWYVDDPLAVEVSVKDPFSGDAVSQATVTVALVGVGSVEDKKTVSTNADGKATLSLTSTSEGHFEVAARAEEGSQKGSSRIDQVYCVQELPFEVGSLSGTPSVSGVTLSGDGNGNLAFSFDTDEQLGTASADIQVTVDGPSTKDAYSFNRNDFSETDNGDGTFTYALTTKQAYDDGEGNYTARVDSAVDPQSNDGAGGEADSYDYSVTMSTSGELDTDFSDNTHSITTALL